MDKINALIKQIETSVSEKKIHSWFSNYANSQVTGNEEYLQAGEVLPFHDFNGVCYIMNEWVNLQDRLIDEMERTQDDPFITAFAFSQRGLTYEEFKYILSGSRPEHYQNHRGFYYLHIINKEAHDYFIATTKDDEKDTMELYMERVEKIARTEIPILKAFFFSYFKKYFPLSALQRHSYIIGGTGSGKSEVMKYLFYGLWNKGKEKRQYSLISLEPHGKLSHELLQFNLMSEDFERVAYLDPFLKETAKKLCGEDILKEDFTFIFNPFQSLHKDPNTINYMTQQLSSAFFEILESEASPQMNALIKACIGTLLYNDGTSISDLKRFMDDENNTDLVNMGFKNPNIEHRSFFKNFEKTALNPTKNGIFYRLQSLIDDIHLRRILVGKSTIDIEDAMNSGKVVICNLSKGAMGRESAPMLGKLIVALVQGYALKRERLLHFKTTFMFLDEMQNYISPSVEEILTESRKYGLHLVFANQVLGQNMNKKMTDMILSNTALKFSGENDPNSFKGIGESMSLKIKDLDKLKKYHFYCYNKINKKQGTVMMKVPPNLTKVKPPFYVSKEKLKEFFLYLAHDSGYYIKTAEVENSRPKNKGGTDTQTKSEYSNPFKD